MSEPVEKSRAIIAIVKGGLGNQLFIYAAARALAVRTSRELFLDNKRGYDADFFGRNYRLGSFPIQAKVMPEEWRVAPTLKHPRHKLIRALNKLLPRNRRSYLAERHHLDARQFTALQPVRERVTLLGYWQAEAYFSDQADLIRRELTPPAPDDERNRELGRSLADHVETVFVHFRRVRYPQALPADYYQRAITAARAELRSPRFVLFGDDLAWPLEHLDFGGAPVELVGHNGSNELADLWLMSRCGHAIVANSSFSWWGAWLGAGKGGHVWAPAQPGVKLTFPARWHRI